MTFPFSTVLTKQSFYTSITSCREAKAALFTYCFLLPLQWKYCKCHLLDIWIYCTWLAILPSLLTTSWKSEWGKYSRILAKLFSYFKMGMFNRFFKKSNKILLLIIKFQAMLLVLRGTRKGWKRYRSCMLFLLKEGNDLGSFSSKTHS